MGEFRMPSLGADMEEGTVIEWRVKPGDEVRRGDIVAVVDTDKADIDVEIFESGIIAELLVPIGERVPIGTPLAIVRATGGDAAAKPPRIEKRPPVAAPVPVASSLPAAKPAGRAPAHHEPDIYSPVIRRLAHHLGVDLAHVSGTGSNGRITRADVEQAAAPVGGTPVVVAAAARADRTQSMRHAIAALMSRSNREIPHYFVSTDIDLDRALLWVARENEARAVTDRALPIVLLLKATARGAREVPEVNGCWTDDELHVASSVHLGIAVSLRGGGLVAPALHDVDEKDLDTLMRDLRDLVQRARTGHLRSSEMSDPTMTVTNLGDQGVDEVKGVIYPPQVALVGIGKIARKPVAVDGLLGVHPVVRITLAGDHRATDGHTGARFLAAMDRLLQQPEELWTPAPQ
jgi:pyruvate dehydrogenase E2 component (dihydrolipoamide acetyltransferase)